ncbi:hypothetical protein AB4238_21260 [Shewanella sp. 10N.286.45.A1]|uniref:hypothetical protein n=1 Tax=Shewanella sp. 10N.286.45.A1 TaxID=3229694 RepID=UPI003552892C
MENKNAEIKSNISITEVLSLAIVWVSILVIVKFINSSPGVVVLGLAAGYYLSKIIILKKHSSSL